MLFETTRGALNQNSLNQIVTGLQNGGTMIYPTDTIYGLGCDIFNKAAIAKIYQLKKRERHKPLSIICSDIKEIAEYAIIPDFVFAILKKTLPGPYTYILKAKSHTPTSFIAKNKTVGIRIPDNKICQQIVAALGNPIITTSLNISEQAILTNPEQLSKELHNKIDIIISAGDLETDPSTIIDLSAGSPVLVRQGKGNISFLSL